MLFRVNIYEYADKQIGDNLLIENILIMEEQRKGTFSIDVSDLNLTLNNDVLLSLAWIRNFEQIGNKGITFDTKKSRKLSGIYLRLSSSGEISKLEHKLKIKPCFFIGVQAK